jgi:predicted transcriptional regulator
MSKNKNKKIENSFVGTIDDFLTHCSQLDFDINEEQSRLNSKEQCIQYIMKTELVSYEDAKIIYNEIAMAEVNDAVNLLIEKGFVEISKYDENGNAVYSITELGKKELNKKP